MKRDQDLLYGWDVIEAFKYYASQILKVTKTGYHHLDCLGRRQKNQGKKKTLLIYYK